MVGLVRYLNRQAHSLDSFGSFVVVVRSLYNKIVHSPFVRFLWISRLWLGSNILKSQTIGHKKSPPRAVAPRGYKQKKGRPKPPKVTYLRLQRPQTRDRAQWLRTK